MALPIANTNWFENLFGIDENDTNIDNVIKKVSNTLKISSGNVYNFGNFRTVSLEKLRSELENDIRRTKYKFKNTEKIAIDYDYNIGIQYPIENLESTSLKKFVFQCDSQLNCLNGSNSDNITNYVGTNGRVNNGKVMSVLCAPGTYYRKYIHPEPIDITQKLNQKMDNAWSIDNGGDKIDIDSNQKQHIEEYLEKTISKGKIDENIYKHVEVGIQENVDIVFNGKLDDDKLHLSTKPIPINKRKSITQVLCCLLNSGNDELNYFHLVAQYEATLLVAAKNYINTNYKIEKVFLCIFDENIISKVEQAKAISEAIISFRKYKIPLFIFINDFDNVAVPAIKELMSNNHLLEQFSDKEATPVIPPKPKLSNSPAKKFSLTKGKTTKKEMNKKIKELVKEIKKLVKISKFTKKVDLPSKYNIEIEKCVKNITNVNKDATEKIIQTTAKKLLEKKTKRKKRKYRSPTFG